MARAAGLDLNAYVIVGIGGQDRSETHARETARVISDMQPAVVRLRTFVPKINTPLLADVQAGRFQMLSPHQVLTETMALLSHLTAPTQVTSDHYTNYLDVAGRLPEDRDAMLEELRRALAPGRVHLPPVLHRHAVSLGEGRGRRRWSRTAPTMPL